ncbi:MAG TPA: hemolysin III family protein [Smithella sp.]|nr:hemolysin III family protein [Smithella sp.]MDM7988644.1 hemolysin III family protein [Smithella sp.]HNY50517.1 hemolysin III family protein [Smithella sp.]HOG90155.1 hemolysin III family protein [Smithella sp.]HOU51934.1 hemolysin III family protein [Smithella sp.]
MPIKKQESFNFYSHLVGAVAALIGTVFLVLVARYSASALITALIYGISVVFLFLASTLYHAFKKEENEKSLWRRLDRLAIFCMIAGTFTPICYMYLQGTWRWSIIAIQWGLVGFGLISQLFFPRAPRVFYAVLYLIMGWMAVVPLKQILSYMNLAQGILLFAGGVFFSLGGLIYATKRPRLVPGIFSFHELFHIMVLIGGALHYAMIYVIYSRLGV